MENSQDEQTPETGIQYIFHGCRWSFELIGLVMACIYLISQRLVMWSVGLFLYTGADDENVVQHIIERKDHKEYNPLYRGPVSDQCRRT